MFIHKLIKYGFESEVLEERKENYISQNTNPNALVKIDPEKIVSQMV